MFLIFPDIFPYEGFLKWTPSYHPFLCGIFHEINHPAALGYPMTMALWNSPYFPMIFPYFTAALLTPAEDTEEAKPEATEEAGVSEWMVDVHGKIPQWMDDNWRYPPSNGENGGKGVKKGTFSIHFGVFRVHPSSLGRGQGFGEQLGRVGKCSFYSKLQNHRI
jgi:hypothetical protein